MTLSHRPRRQRRAAINNRVHRAGCGVAKLVSDGVTEAASASSTRSINHLTVDQRHARAGHAGDRLGIARQARGDQAVDGARQIRRLIVTLGHRAIGHTLTGIKRQAHRGRR